LACIFTVGATPSFLHSLAQHRSKTILINYWGFFFCKLFGPKVLEQKKMCEPKESCNEKKDDPGVDIELQLIGATISIARTP
jgi:hypothetical protein